MSGAEVEPHFRRIEPRDDPVVASIIRDTLAEFGCVGCGFASSDAEVDAMTAAYMAPRHAFFVVELDGVISGCGGFAPLDGAGDPTVAEVRKMYFRPSLRGRRVGTRLLQMILDGMRAAGFAEAYLETTTQMEAARALYARFGFVELATPRGQTGHGGCDRYYVLGLNAPA